MLNLWHGHSVDMWSTKTFEVVVIGLHDYCARRMVNE